MEFSSQSWGGIAQVQPDCQTIYKLSTQKTLKFRLTKISHCRVNSQMEPKCTEESQATAANSDWELQHIRNACQAQLQQISSIFVNTLQAGHRQSLKQQKSRPRRGANQQSGTTAERSSPFLEDQHNHRAQQWEQHEVDGVEDDPGRYLISGLGTRARLECYDFL